MTCNGNKMINGMGHMKEKCPQCKGVGTIAVPEKPAVKPKKAKEKKD